MSKVKERPLVPDGGMNGRLEMTTYTVVYAYLDKSGMAQLYYDATQAKSPKQAALKLATKVPTVPTDALVFRGEHYDSPTTR